jgi:hypothetical protein
MAQPLGHPPWLALLAVPVGGTNMPTGEWPPWWFCHRVSLGQEALVRAVVGRLGGWDLSQDALGEGEARFRPLPPDRQGLAGGAGQPTANGGAA